VGEAATTEDTTRKKDKRIALSTTQPISTMFKHGV